MTSAHEEREFTLQLIYIYRYSRCFPMCYVCIQTQYGSTGAWFLGDCSPNKQVQSPLSTALVTRTHTHTSTSGWLCRVCVRERRGRRQLTKIILYLPNTILSLTLVSHPQLYTKQWLMSSDKYNIIIIIRTCSGSFTIRAYVRTYMYAHSHQ